jgi:hypothetical protein
MLRDYTHAVQINSILNCQGHYINKRYSRIMHAIVYCRILCIPSSRFSILRLKDTSDDCTWKRRSSRILRCVDC